MVLKSKNDELSGHRNQYGLKRVQIRQRPNALTQHGSRHIQKDLYAKTIEY